MCCQIPWTCFMIRKGGPFMDFSQIRHPYPSRRSVTYGRRGMVATSQTLAAQAGLAMLKQGGNAADAIIATAIAMTVLEPTSNGLGSDAFALYWSAKDHQLFGLNGSGWAPQALTLDRSRCCFSMVRPTSSFWQAALQASFRAGAVLRRRRVSCPACDKSPLEPERPNLCAFKEGRSVCPAV